MVRPSILALLKSEPFFQRNFCSDQNFSTKRNQKTFFKGSLESAWVNLSFKTNRLKKPWEFQKWCAPQFWPFWNPSHIFSASFVQMKISLRRGIRNCSLRALWRVLGYTFHLNKPFKKILRTPDMVRPSFLGLSRNKPLFQRKFFSNGFFPKKRDQKMCGDGSLEIVSIYLSFKTNRLKNYWELQKWCAPQFWRFWNPSCFVNACSQIAWTCSNYEWLLCCVEADAECQ